MARDKTFRMARFLYYAGCLTISQLTIRPAVGITLSDFLFFGSLIAATLELLIYNRKIELRIPSLFIFSCFVFIAGGLLSLFNINDKVTVLSVIARFVYLTIIWFWLGTMVLRSVDQIKRAIVFWLISIAISGIAAALQLLDPSIIPGTEPRWGRMVGFTLHPNDLGAISAIGWGTALIFFSRYKLINNNIIRTIISVSILSGLILAGSTGAAIAAFSATIYYLFITKSIKRGIVITLIVVAIGLPTLTFQHFSGGKSVLHRLNKTIFRTGAPSTLSMRLIIYKQALEEISKNPIIGVGFEPGGARVGQDDLNIGGGSAVHNIYLAALYEAGLLGIVGFLLLTLYVLLLINRMLKKDGPYNNERHLVITLSSAVIAFLVYAQGAPVLYQRYGWISLSLLFCLRSIIHRNINSNLSLSNRGI